jgi:hypothetical protein
MLSLLTYLPLLVIAVVAQWSDRHRLARWMTFGLLLSLTVTTAVGAALALVIGLSETPPPTFSPVSDRTRWDVAGLIALATVAMAVLTLLPAVRRKLARHIPIEADATVHAAALALAALAVGLNLAQVPLIGGLETLAASTESVPVGDLLLSNLPIGLFALVGVGLWIRRSPRETWHRLGLARLTGRQVIWTVGLALAISTFYYGVDSVWRALDPESYALMDAVGETLYGGATGLWQGIALSLAAGVTEELFFRGALQPRFGFWLTAVIFTAAHIQYGLTPATLEVFGGALALGWLRQRTHTGACILLHVLYNVIGLVIFPLLP